MWFQFLLSHHTQFSEYEAPAITQVHRLIKGSATTRKKKEESCAAVGEELKLSGCLKGRYFVQECLKAWGWGVV